MKFWNNIMNSLKARKGKQIREVCKEGFWGGWK